MADWGVIVSQPQRHKVVAASLTDRSIEYFMPLVEDVSIIKRRHHRELRPLFGRYVLVVIGAGWEMMQTLRGVAGMLLVPDDVDDDPRLVPALVSEIELERVRAACSNNIYRDPVKSNPRVMSYGERVTPKSGPFQSFVGRYDCKTRKGGDAAFFSLFGREQRVIFKRGELTRA